MTNTVADKTLTKISTFQRAFEILKKEAEPELTKLGIELNQVVKVEVDTSRLEKRRDDLQKSLDTSTLLLDPSAHDGLPQKLRATDQQIAQLQLQLDAPSRKYQDYLHQMEEWTVRQKAINGSEDTPGSLIYLKNILDEISAVPGNLALLKSRRTGKARDIFENISRLASTYRESYSAVKDFIQNHNVANDKLQLNFEVSIENVGFEDRFFDQVSRGATGSFMGMLEGHTALVDILKKYDFNQWDQVELFMEEITDHLHLDRRTNDDTPIQIADQLRKGYTVGTLYDYIFSQSYLQPKYTLRQGDKDLSQLSPG